MQSPGSLLRRTWFTFRFTGASKEEKGNESSTVTVSSFWSMPMAATMQWWLTKKLQKATLEKKTASPQQKKNRLYSSGAQSDAFASLKLYISRLTPSCKHFFQHPKPNVTADDTSLTQPMETRIAKKCYKRWYHAWYNFFFFLPSGREVVEFGPAFSACGGENFGVESGGGPFSVWELKEPACFNFIHSGVTDLRFSCSPFQNKHACLSRLFFDGTIKAGLMM